MTGTRSPCKGCKARQVGCHATCESYQEFSEGRQRIYEIRREVMILNESDIHKRRKSWQLKRSEGCNSKY